MARPSSPSTHATWAAHVKQASSAICDDELAAAVRRFEQLPMAQRFRLVREAAETRGPEYARSHDNVVMVAAGMKRRQADGGRTVALEPCVIFFVKRKWARDERPETHPLHLPRRLLAHVDGQQRRDLVALPTDVQIANRLSGVRPQDGRAICVELGGVPTEFGTITTLVRVDGLIAQPVVCAMSAQHVLSPDFRANLDNRPQAGNVVTVARGFVSAGVFQQEAHAVALGTTLAIGGSLHDGAALSFDVQFAEVPVTDALSRQLADMRLSPDEPSIASPDRYDELVGQDQPPEIDVLVAENHPMFNSPRDAVRLTHSGWPGDRQAIPYIDSSDPPARLMVHQRDMLEFKFFSSAKTVAGDSGAPVVLRFSDGTCTLVGMHVAVNDDVSCSYVVPAWQLFAVANYSGTLPEGAVLSPLASTDAQGDTA